MKSVNRRSGSGARQLILAAAAGLSLGVLVFAVLPSGWLFVPPAGEAVVESQQRWACPMLCTILSGPGICPVCGMDLHELSSTLSLSEQDGRMIDLRLGTVQRRPLSKEIRTFGRLSFAEDELRTVTAWAEGRIVTRFVASTFTQLEAGDPIVALYSPSLYAAQSEYLSAVATRRGTLQSAARERLLLQGFMNTQVDELARTGEPTMVTNIRAPLSGTVTELFVREGDWVTLGQPIFTIARYDPLWLRFDAYEQNLPWLAVGAPVEMSVASHPGRTFDGQIALIEGEVDERTRTVKVRVVVPNPAGDLLPGMYANVTVLAALGLHGRAVFNPDGTAGDPEAVMAIPRSAVLDTGLRQVVFVAVEGDGAQTEFLLREVQLGPSAREWVMVRDGLDVGERIVVRGAMLIDSQLQLLGQPSLLVPEGSAVTTATEHSH